jgi:ferric-dicitrate binding protein FerR (iron transport regulator)
MNRELQPGSESMIARAKQLLDQSVTNLDPATARRLQHARAAALESKPTSRWWMVWGGGLAMAGVAALAVTLWMKQPLSQNHHAPLFEDIDLVLSAENVELAEDLEFYHWLADADTTG